MIIGLIISLIFNLILLVAAFVVCVRFVQEEARVEFNREQWSKWEQEYWRLRCLDQNSSIKLSWVASGEITKEQQ